MLALIRLFLMTIALVIISVVVCLYSLLRPFHRNNVYVASMIMGKMAKLIGLTVVIRIPDSVKKVGSAVYICNHQNSYDLLTVSNAVQPNTVTLGKKSLKWIPFFGQMYWLTGNILIDRKNASKAMNTIAIAAKKIKEKQLSVLLFPEGTRSKGKGLLPFKRGAFLTAIQADVPIVPMCVSNLHGAIQLNRWNNGTVIIECLDPVQLSNDDKNDIKSITTKAHRLMSDKIEQLNEEIASAAVESNKSS